MANYSNRAPSNTPGKWYVDADCVDCGMCPEIAPMYFRRDDNLGVSIVHTQPPDDDPLAREAMEACPAETIGNDGQG